MKRRPARAPRMLTATALLATATVALTAHAAESTGVGMIERLQLVHAHSTPGDMPGSVIVNGTEVRFGSLYGCAPGRPPLIDALSDATTTQTPVKVGYTAPDEGFACLHTLEVLES